MQKKDPLYDDSVLEEDQPFLIFYTDDVNTPESMNPEDLSYLTQFIQSLPDVLTSNTAALYFVEDDLFLNQNDDLEHTGDIYGVSDVQNVAASIRLIHQNADQLYTLTKEGEQVILSNPDFYKETIVHELSHLLDLYSSGTGNLTSYSAEFRDLYEAAPDLLGEYGSTARTEYFAEAGVYYFLYPDRLKQLSLPLFEFFEARYPYLQTELTVKTGS